MVENPEELQIDDDFVRRMHEAQQKNKQKWEVPQVIEQAEIKETKTVVHDESKDNVKDSKDQSQVKQGEPVDIEKGQAKYIHKALKKAYRKKENTKTHKNKPKEKISYE